MNYTERDLNALVASHIFKCNVVRVPIKKIGKAPHSEAVLCGCPGTPHSTGDGIHNYVSDPRYAEAIIVESQKRAHENKDKQLLHFDITLPRDGVFRVKATPFEVNPKDTTAFSTNLGLAASLSILAAWGVIDRDVDTIEKFPESKEVEL